MFLPFWQGIRASHKETKDVSPERTIVAGFSQWAEAWGFGQVKPALESAPAFLQSSTSGWDAPFCLISLQKYLGEWNT